MGGENEIDFLRVILSEYGLAMALSLIFSFVMFRLYLLERADRKAAWKAHNELVKESNEVLSKLTQALLIIQERLK